MLFLTTAANAAGTLNLTWQDNSDNEVGFEIERSLDGVGYEVIGEVSADVQSYSDEGVIPGIPYSYRVRAYNEFGYSGYTNVSVGAADNTAPAVGTIQDLEVLRGDETQFAAIPVDVSDAESSLDELSFEILSSNLELLPLNRVSLEIVEGVASLSVDPVRTTAGSSEVTLLLSDGAEMVETSFLVSVLPNYVPTVSAIEDLAVYDGVVVDGISVSVSDRESAGEDLLVTVASSNEGLIPSQSIELMGTGESRSLRFATSQGGSGEASITVSVSDGVNSASQSFQIVVSENEVPTIVGLASELELGSGQSVDGLSFTIGDGETSPAELQVSVSSSNTLLVPESGIVLSGTGTSRTLQITPAARQHGTAVITVEVFDGVKTTTHSIEVTVAAPDGTIELVDFRVENGHAVAEVMYRSGVDFALVKTDSLRGGEWTPVEGLEIELDGNRVTLRDPQAIEGAVYYQAVIVE
ncbi:fibronectin type III domain-containing protein [Pelagicoccus sp. SDUM812003]|uniref:fibronectin type III domain-containing protein n=1 Tax=Pelagicoccus sp. SDUM812003 TaxID=3041267 RepID=UPI002811BB6D|nr:fibronectin type III domain-containing protein [Pelagicoccus sp. SDUM812003]